MSRFVEVQISQPHPRKLIRNRIRTLLRENTFLDDKWFCSRPNPVWMSELPVGLIYFQDEPADHEGNQPRVYKRTCELITEVLIAEETERDNSADDFLDARCWEIEYAMLTDQFLGLDKLVESTILKRTQPAIYRTEGQTNVESTRMFWEIVYRTGSYGAQSRDEFLKFTADLGLIAIDTTIRNS